MKTFSRKSISTLLLMLSFLTVYSCGSDDDDDDNDLPQQEQDGPQQQSTGNFRAVVLAINPTVMNSITSTNNVNISGNVVRVTNRVTGASPNFTHSQHIHNGRSCPTIADDANGDGFVDGVEAQNRTGGVLIPLDSDINTQEGGRNSYPRTNAAGTYNYSERGSLDAMIADLIAPDPNTSDEVIKLNPGDGINISGAVFEIHGVPNTVSLPATVAGLPGQTPHQSFPVACGLFQQVAADENEDDGNDGGALSCRVPAQILCPTGQRDGCETGQSTTHRCVTPNERSCTLEIAILCPAGFRDGCETNQTQVHRCVRQQATSCDQDLQILCPVGFRDGCETGQTQVHRCVRQNQVACTEPLQILCPTGFHDGCTDGRTETHQCISDTP